MSVQHPSARIKPLGMVAPLTLAPGSSSTAWVSLGDVRAVMALVMVGVIAATGTVAARIEESHGGDDAARNANATDVEDAAITVLVAGTDSNKAAAIDLTHANVLESTTHVRLTITTAAAASPVCGVVLGVDPRYAKTGAAGAMEALAEVVSL
ncbi:MAG: hypothetical protein AAFX81_16010 [Pseudomonadota bacterium]